ncbi:MAG: amidohydrolase family protein [Planctomycetes bacterium]|nr:amidohydrolase family protein [Planctomycetota bacterium]
MRIDAHQHFWRYDAAAYPWIDARMQRIARDFLPADLAPLLAGCGLDGAIAVQARSSLDETRFLLDLARDHDCVKAVVGWADLCASDLDETLDELCADPALRGLRHVVQDEPDDQFLLRNDFQAGVAKLAARGLVYDILIYPRQLDAAVSFVAALPDQPFVLDHLAKPGIAERRTDDWLLGFEGLAQFEQVSCKVSGMVTEANWNAWQPSDFRVYLDKALEAFGIERLLFGSDWPVCLLAADGYRDVYGLVDDWAAQLSESEREQLFGGNAARIYGLA